MPPEVARWVADRIAAVVAQLRKANGRPATAKGAVERLVILEQALADLADLRAMLTAWTAEDAAVTLTLLSEYVRRSGTTLARRYDSRHVDRLKTLE